MNIYLIPIKEAIAVFPLLAIIITFPYMIYQYRKYGSIPLFRSVIMYSFVLYLLCMYFLVILPLPSINEVAGYTGPQTQLVPFQFDVDDLMLNTGGGMLGYISSAIFMRLLPSREHLDKIAYEKGLHVSFCRRLAAFILDWTILAVIGVPTVILTSFMPPVFFLIQLTASFFLPVLYFVMCTYLTNGYTPGKWLLRIRISSCNEEKALTLQQCILRFGTLYLIFIPFLIIWACYHLFCTCTGRPGTFIYEQISKTSCISTIGQNTAHPHYRRHYLLTTRKI